MQQNQIIENWRNSQSDDALIAETVEHWGLDAILAKSDYIDVEKEMSLVPAPLEGGAIVHLNGLYYVIGSHLTAGDQTKRVGTTIGIKSRSGGGLVARPNGNGRHSRLTADLLAVQLGQPRFSWGQRERRAPQTTLTLCARPTATISAR